MAGPVCREKRLSPLFGLGVLLGKIDGECALAFVLGVVQGDVGMLQGLVEAIAFQRIERYAYAGPIEKRPFPVADASALQGEQFAGQIRGFPQRVQGKNQHKFVPTVAAAQPGMAPGKGGEQGGEGFDRLVPVFVTKLIVDDLEVIHVDEEKAERLVGAGRDQLLRLLAEERTSRQAGERVRKPFPGQMENAQKILGRDVTGSAKAAP